MANALVRNLDDQVYERLKARAVGNNRSLEAELRDPRGGLEAGQYGRGEGPRRGDTATPVGPNPLRLGRADPGGPRHPMSDATPAPTPVVVDASVGLKWYVTEVHSGEAARLLGEEFEPHVPSHFYVELASALEESHAAG